MSDFESLLERMVPGAARTSMLDAEAPSFPTDLGLEPLGVIGRGGVGWVFRARDPVLDREVAVKISRPDGGAPARQAMLAEATLTARVQHPAVVPVHRVLASHGLLIVQYMLAPSATVAGRWADCRDGAADWSLADRVRVLAVVAGAVARAHAVGVVHGDLHPGNLALGPSGEPYVLDWSGTVADSGAGSIHGHPGYLASELLRDGGAPGPPADVFAMGALLYELVALKPFRPRRRDESLGEYVARWRDQAVPDLGGLDPTLCEVCRSALGEATSRPDAATFAAALEAWLTGASERARREADAAAKLEDAQGGLARVRELSERLERERRVVAVQRTKVQGFAPIEQKRPLWNAEDRVEELRHERWEAWVAATEAATLALSLAADPTAARELLAELWWERMRVVEAEGDALETRISRARVERFDTGRYVRLLRSPSLVSLTTSVPASVRVHRFVEVDRRLVPEVVDEVSAPLDRLPLAPGSWLLTVHAEGRATTRYPVLLDRLQHHEGHAAVHTAAAIGDGWVLVPGGPFRLGGDPLARQPLDPCTPSVGDLFVQRTCVTTAAYRAFLDDVDPEVARRYLPGDQGLFGGFQTAWQPDGDRWHPPEGWDLQWPIFSVNHDDVVAYCAWLSAGEGRVVRLPTEEEWEKAARGVDGRSYPWGNGFDPTYCHMRQSRSGPPRPAVVGSYPVDESVYGCRDMAGGMREVTASMFDEGQLVIRGGTWGDDPNDCRCACRAGVQPWFRNSFVSFRLVADEPRP